MEMMASMQAQMHNRFDALDEKISGIQERKTNKAMWISKGMKRSKQKGSFKFISLFFIRYMHKRSLKDDIQRSKRSLKITRLYEDEVINILEETFFKDYL
ncbi:hypothetical protein M9H77_08975 [Catharanthus roseus]|uniref:Uncharacterized protein n=1 Tax=Catharanthus roseus TaxID=4058 RepID=A0ACC0BZD4_CATRO|nr:hypothetical protein M9H77_08975 [Catharanthus roseus]